MPQQKSNSLELIEGLVHMPPVLAAVYDALCRVVAELAVKLQEASATIREYEEAVQKSELSAREGVYGKLWDD